MVTTTKFTKGKSGNPAKACRICSVEQDIQQFYSNSNNTDGKDTRCKSCEALRRKKAYFSHFERETFNRIKSRSKKNGVLFTLALGDIPRLAKICPILGCELEINWGGRAQAFNSPTLDKIEPSLGYVPGNVAWISSKANSLKMDNTRETLIAILEYIDDRK